MKKMIVKAQRSIFPATGKILVYDKTKRFIRELPAKGALLKAMGKDYRTYLLVHLDRYKNLHVVKRLPDQKW